MNVTVMFLYFRFNFLQMQVAGHKRRRISTVGADINYLGMGQSVGGISNLSSSSEETKVTQ